MIDSSILNRMISSLPSKQRRAMRLRNARKLALDSNHQSRTSLSRKYDRQWWRMLGCHHDKCLMLRLNPYDDMTCHIRKANAYLLILASRVVRSFAEASKAKEVLNRMAMRPRRRSNGMPAYLVRCQIRINRWNLKAVEELDLFRKMIYEASDLLGPQFADGGRAYAIIMMRAQTVYRTKGRVVVSNMHRLSVAS